MFGPPPFDSLGSATPGYIGLRRSDIVLRGGPLWWVGDETCVFYIDILLVTLVLNQRQGVPQVPQCALMFAGDR
jgi:hypothetical protein